MIKKILQELKLLGYEHIVFSEDILRNALFKLFDADNIHYITDVRSATFFAFGEAKILCRPVILLVDERYISNCYTALMEAWMQRVKIVVVAYNSAAYKTTLYLERCLDYVEEIKDEKSVVDIIKKVNLFNGPVLLKVGVVVDEDKTIDYRPILDALSKLENCSGILCYNASHESLSNNNVINIETRHKYGILSKYIGMLISGKNYILCVPDYLLLLETNVFCLRDFPTSFRLIVLKTDKSVMDRIQSWAKNNKISVSHINSNSAILAEINKTTPSILCVQ